jgi:hypothetical protein
LVKKCFDGKIRSSQRAVKWSRHTSTDGPREIAQIASLPVAPCQAIDVQESMAWSRAAASWRENADNVDNVDNAN